jgi:hypothetical protein
MRKINLFSSGRCADVAANIISFGSEEIAEFQTLCPQLKIKTVK